MISQEEKITKIIKQNGFIRARDLKKRKLHRTSLTRLCDKDKIQKLSWGLYSLKNAEITAHHNFAELSKKVPHGIICLLSALSFYEIGTQLPGKIWLALKQGVSTPKIKYPPFRVVRFSGVSFSSGVKKHKIEGVSVSVTCLEKTIADCFKFRNKIGIDVAIEALKDGIKSKKCRINELEKYSSICRVQKIIMPYIQTLI